MIWIAFAIAAAALAAGIPRRLVRRSQDRLARGLLEAAGSPSSYSLLTPAELCLGRFQRLPGVLGLTAGEIVFQSLFSDRRRIALLDVSKIVTGRVRRDGRRLWRQEVLRVTAGGADEAEWQMSHATAEQWRRHLGEWAARRKGARL